MNSSKRVVWGAVALISIAAIGVVGYMAVEGWSFLDSLYMTVITITTVGFTEVHPLSGGGRIFSVFLIIGGVGGALYAITGIVQYIVEGNIGATWERRRMRNRIARLKGHYILCGFGRVGEEVARTFKEEGVSFLIVENRPAALARLEQTDYLFLAGDATRDEVLRETGVERAQGLVAAVGTDADNTYITLSARRLCPELFIEARASSQEAATKLEQAGANRVILPEVIGGRRMAMLVLRPAVVDFIDTVIRSRGREIQLETVDVGEKSRLVGMTIGSTRSQTGITTLAIRKKNGAIIANPADEVVIEEDEQLIVMGTKARLAALEEALKPEALDTVREGT
jgi:voltage-gated potassium channel